MIVYLPYLPYLSFCHFILFYAYLFILSYAMQFCVFYILLGGDPMLYGSTEQNK
jgi:hypothetical protein